MSSVSPSDAVELSEEAAEGAADAAADHAAAEGAADGSVDAESMGGNTSIKSALLHTEPRIPPAQAKRDLGVDDGGAHAYIGLRKFAAGLGVGDEDGDGGTPAVLNFGIAGLHFAGFDLGGEDDAGDDEETAALEAADEEEIDDPAVAGGA